VDPYYLTYKSEGYGYHPKVINSGRYVNDSMGFYIAKKTVKSIIATGKHIQDAKVLVMGATFKEDVSDIRNSKVADIISELKSYAVHVDVTDPNASSNELMHEYGFDLIDQPGNGYDAVIIAVNHNEFLKLDEPYFKSILSEKGVIVDIKGIFRQKLNGLSYWSL
jgi:UDP-N-acetyl-D-galactosamine dehydrogenase